MASDTDGPRLVVSLDQPNAPPYRPFLTRPTGIFVDAVADHIRTTGEPETYVGLFRGRIDRSAKFRLLRKITIDRKKRPNGDMAPCPRCGCDDKFLGGALAWFPDLQCCAVIGHCCADNEALDEAEREFKSRQLLDQQETYLLAGLPLLGLKARLLDQLRTPAAEALRLYRQFRRQGSEIFRHLHDIKTAKRGQLTVVEILRGGEEEVESDYVGPAGFRGRGNDGVETRDHDFGIVSGLTALIRNYDPVKELDEVGRWLDSFGGTRPTEADALDMIVEMGVRERRAAVAIVRGVDRGYEKFERHLRDFWSFFTPENAERLNAYGSHPNNHFPMQVSYVASKGRAGLIFRYDRNVYKLTFPEGVDTLEVAWPVLPFGKLD